MALLTGLGLAVPAGLNAYIPLLAVGLSVRFGLLELHEPYDLLGEWWAIALMAVLFLVEVVADKIPGVDHANDVVQTMVRPAAGGVLFVAASSAAVDAHPALLVAAGVIVAGGVHAAKAAARPAVNVSTGGAGAPLASLVEDVAAAVMSLVAVLVPVLVGVAIVAVVVVWWRLRTRSRPAS